MRLFLVEINFGVVRFEGWYLNEKLHRENGPAITESNSSEFWYKNNVIIKKRNKFNDIFMELFK